eukprot:4994506-Ditylum_brightwellii.AAC.1
MGEEMASLAKVRGTSQYPLSARTQCLAPLKGAKAGTLCKGWEGTSIHTIYAKGFESDCNHAWRDKGDKEAEVKLRLKRTPDKKIAAMTTKDTPKSEEGDMEPNPPKLWAGKRPPPVSTRPAPTQVDSQMAALTLALEKLTTSLHEDRKTTAVALEQIGDQLRAEKDKRQDLEEYLL